MPDDREPLEKLPAWESFFLARRSFSERSVVAMAVTVVGFFILYVLFHFTDFYFSSLTMIIVILIGLYCGFYLSAVFAIIVGLASDYYFILPIGSIFDTPFAYEHFFIVTGLALLMASLGSSLRNAFWGLISERNRADIASKTMEGVLAHVVHDIRDPLSGVQMGIETILATVKIEKHRTILEIMLRSIKQVHRTARSLLDVASMRAGKTIALELEQCDLSAEVGKIIEEISQGASNKLDFVARESIWGAWGMNGVRRAVENLVNNAVKYGELNAPIMIKLELDGGNRAMLSVHNQGNEIGPEDQTNLFQPFWRADAVKNGEIDGCGLGLSLVQGVAIAHGGIVSLKSGKIEGTIFTLELPVRGAVARR
jgi:signal transduction histidine kinase